MTSDSGSLPESRLLELFEPGEVKRVLARRRERLTAELQDLDRLERLVPWADGDVLMSRVKRRVSDAPSVGEDGHEDAMAVTMWPAHPVGRNE